MKCLSQENEYTLSFYSKKLYKSVRSKKLEYRVFNKLGKHEFISKGFFENDFVI
jgi:hypothetical protein